MGVRQGGPESPVLFNFKFFKYGYAIPSGASNTESTHLNLGVYGNVVIDWLGYADDLVLCFLHEESLPDAINLLDSIFKRFHLALNIGKTKTMIFNHPTPEAYPKSIVSLNDEVVENVTVFRYLGSDIKHDEESTGDEVLPT